MAMVAQYEKRILAVLNGKGWNAYKSTDTKQIGGSDEVIRRGPARSLEVGERYVVLPDADNPSDPKKVWAALERVAVRLNRETPTIIVRRERFPWVGFVPQEEDVKINTTLGHFVPYHEFVESLETIYQV